MASYSWKNNDTLELVLRYIESPHKAIYTCRFIKNQLIMVATRSYDKNKVTVEATEQ